MFHGYWSFILGLIPRDLNFQSPVILSFLQWPNHLSSFQIRDSLTWLLLNVTLVVCWFSNVSSPCYRIKSFPWSNQSHVTEPKSFFLECPLVHCDQAFSVVVVFILEDIAFHPCSFFFLWPRPNPRHHMIDLANRNHHATRWNVSYHYTWESKQDNTRSPCQVAILVALLKNTSGYPSTIDISRYLYFIIISILLVNTLSRMHKFLFSTFACFRSKILQVSISHQVCIQQVRWPHLSSRRIQCQITATKSRPLV